jgi:hypothetical protein
MRADALLASDYREQAIAIRHEGRRPGAVQAIVLLLQCVLGAMGVTILAPIILRIIAN